MSKRNFNRSVRNENAQRGERRLNRNHVCRVPHLKKKKMCDNIQKKISDGRTGRVASSHPDSTT